MSSSETAIANRALNLLGAARIDTMDSDTPNARAISKVFSGCREEVLQAYDWGFARARALLAVSSVPSPVFEFAYYFQKPGDCLQVRRCQSGDSRDPVAYIEEGQFIASSEEELYLCYTKDVTSTGYFPPLFVTALAYRMAIECCYSVTKSTKLLPELRSGYAFAISEAQRVDSAHQHRVIVKKNDPWTQARI